MQTNIINVALSYERTPYIEVAHTNCLAGSLNIFIGKTLVLSSSVLFTCPFIDGKLYYNDSLFLNRSIDPTSTSL